MSTRALIPTFALVLAMCCAACKNDVKEPPIVPKPAEMTVGNSYYQIPNNASVTFNNVEDVDKQRLMGAINQFAPQAATTDEDANISLNIGQLESSSSPEAYELLVNKNGVTITANEPAGLFYGLQSLIQSLDEQGNSPVMTIADAPRLPYRGLMIDTSRHFRDADFIRKQIDAMAAVKLNRLHLHLTDAAGWRLEIDKYPRLTNYAAWRPQETWAEWTYAGMPYCNEDDPNAHGGYITKDQARDIVKYAADRYITVIPEIEMPSHSEEVTAAFPQLACKAKRDHYPDVCIGNPETLEFFQNVLEEVMEIFPSEYIHIGGDEASMRAWKLCKLCQNLMKREGLNNVEELQSYMITNIEKWLNEHGRSIIGWDEILKGGLAPNATVMSWTGTLGGIQAAQAGHDAIMVPGSYCYLDSYQDAPYSQPEAFGGYLPMERVYSYNPAPDSLGEDVQKRIVGVQGNIWAEKIPTAELMEYMVYPRLYAIAEIGWTPQEKREWEDFHQRASTFNRKMRANGYNAFDMDTEIGNRPESKEQANSIAINKPVTYNAPYWKVYSAAGDGTLTDGKQGGWNYSDQMWQGFLYSGNQSMDVTIDLEEPQDISYVGANFMQNCGPDVWFPQEVVISASEDGEHYTQLKKIAHEQVRDNQVAFEEYAWKAPEGEAQKARYVRYQAKSDHGVLFTDEVIIR